MSESPTPNKRRGLALPPRGQALARLQDLEQEAEPDTVTAAESDKAPILTEGSNAVNTARSNAVNIEGSTAVRTASREDGGIDVLAPVAVKDAEAAATPGIAHQPAVRAAREPTTRITVDMPDSLHRKISLLSVETRRSIKDLVIEALAVAYFGTEQTDV